MDHERSRAGRPTSAEAARLTERLRRAAVDTFLEHGYDGTTMEAVAQAAGITKSTLYARYPDKHALFVAVSSWALTRLERDERVLEPLPDDLGAALTVIAGVILARTVDPDIVRLSRMAIAESTRFPEFAASSRATTWTPRIRMIMDVLGRHERTGAVVVEDVEIAAEQFFAMIGAMPAWLAAYGIRRTPEVEQRHIRHAVRLFLDGVLARRGSKPAAGAAADGTAWTSQPGPMEYRRVGRSGLRVSRLAMGTAGWGDEQTATELVDRYLDAGGNLLDTGDGTAEEICGRALRGRRSEVVLAATAGPTAEQGGNSRRHLRAACEASLRRLRTDHIDLYQVDLDDRATPLEETVEALDDLVRSGKVLYVGAANFRAYRLMKALSISDRLGRARFVSVHGRFDPMERSLEREHLPLLDEEGLGLISPSPPTDETVALRKAATEIGCTPAQLALAWQWTKPVTSVVVGARTVTELEHGLAATSIEIPTGIAAEIERATSLSNG